MYMLFIEIRIHLAMGWKPNFDLIVYEINIDWDIWQENLNFFVTTSKYALPQTLTRPWITVYFDVKYKSLDSGIIVMGSNGGVIQVRVWTWQSIWWTLNDISMQIFHPNYEVALSSSMHARFR